MQGRPWRLSAPLIAAAVTMLVACEEVLVHTIDPHRIEISPPGAYLMVDASTTLAATLYTADGESLGGRGVQWTSLHPDLASVDGQGTVRGLKPGTARIRATAGDVSTTINVSVLRHDGPLRSPTDVTATPISSSQLSVSWTPRGGWTHFEVRRRTGTNGAWSSATTVPGHASVYLDSGLSSRTTYQYEVRSCNNRDCSRYSSRATATTAG
jgi:hypothetical protein